MIEIRNLEYRYRPSQDQELVALQGISLEIRQGESLAIIGANGSGKSTLALCLNGLLTPGAGQVLVDGWDVAQPANLPEVRRRVGMVFQNPDNQIISTTVEREIAFGLENLAVPSPQLRQRVEQTLAQFHLASLRHRPPHLLSGGEKQRLSIAAVLAMRPKYLVLDEPTSLLDPLSQAEIRQLLWRLQRQEGVTVVHITQFPEEAAQAERVLVLAEGRLVADGPPEEVFAHRERLVRLGLRVPFPVELAHQLSQKGLQLPGPVSSLEDLVAGLAACPQLGHRRTSDTTASTTEPAARRAIAAERIRAEGLWYRYHSGLPSERVALRGVDLSIRRGEGVGLAGSIGSGKSTLVQHFNALLVACAGRVLVDGQELPGRDKDLPQLRRKVGLVFQFPERQLFEETVSDDVAFGPRHLDLSEDQVQRRVRAALEGVGLDADRFSPRSPFDLSGGEQRRVAIAGVLAMDPEILILDEPFVGLDPRGCEQILDMLQQLKRRQVTVVLISHHIDFLAPLVGRLVVMRDGRVAADGAIEAILAEPGQTAQLGLDLPPAALMAWKLQQQGWSIERPVVTMEQAVELILSHWMPANGSSC